MVASFCEGADTVMSMILKILHSSLIQSLRRNPGLLLELNYVLYIRQLSCSILIYLSVFFLKSIYLGLGFGFFCLF